MLSLQIALQRFAHADLTDDIFSLAMNDVECSLGFFFRAIFQLGEFKAALAVEFVFDDVFGRLGHGHTCLFWCGLSSVSSWSGG